MGKSKILGAALAGMLQAQAKRMPKDKILKKNRVGSLVGSGPVRPAAEAEATTEAGTPSGVSGSKTCSGRRRTSHATAAERAADYVKRVREGWRHADLGSRRPPRKATMRKKR